MKITRCNGFLFSKGDSKIAECADSISFNETLTRFAIADGVTKSYFPRFVSRALTENFIKRTDNAQTFFDPPAIIETLNAVIGEWDTRAMEEEEKAEGLRKEILELRRNKTPFGASTFAGLSIQDDFCEIVSLGDSCIFIIPSDEEVSPVMFTSMPTAQPEPEDNFFFKCNFGSNPHFIDTSGRICGDPLTAKTSLKKGWILIMTDALSEWFVKHFTRTERETTLQSLITIETDDDFASFIQNQRNIDLNDDDSALIILEVDDDDTKKINQIDSYEMPKKKIYYPLVKFEKIILEI